MAQRSGDRLNPLIPNVECAICPLLASSLDIPPTSAATSYMEKDSMSEIKVEVAHEDVTAGPADNQLKLDQHGFPLRPQPSDDPKGGKRPWL